MRAVKPAVDPQRRSDNKRLLQLRYKSNRRQLRLRLLRRVLERPHMRCDCLPGRLLLRVGEWGNLLAVERCLASSHGLIGRIVHCLQQLLRQRDLLALVTGAVLIDLFPCREQGDRCVDV